MKYNCIFKSTGDYIISAIFLVIFVVNTISWWCDLVFISYITIGIINFYLISVLFIAAIRSDKSKTSDWKFTKLLPHRAAGLIVFFLVLLSVVFGFAAIFNHEDIIHLGRAQALYDSFISITSFSYNDHNKSSRNFKAFQMWQSGTALLVFTGVFGFLISRISDFKSKENNL